MRTEAKLREAGSLLFRMKVWAHDATFRPLAADFLKLGKDVVDEIRRAASVAGPSMARARVMESLATDDLILLFRKEPRLVARPALEPALPSTRNLAPRGTLSSWEFVDLPGQDALEVCQAYLHTLHELAARTEQLP